MASPFACFPVFSPGVCCPSTKTKGYQFIDVLCVIITSRKKNEIIKALTVLKEKFSNFKVCIPEYFEGKEIAEKLQTVVSKRGSSPIEYSLMRGYCLLDIACACNPPTFVVYCIVTGANALELGAFEIAMEFFSRASQFVQDNEEKSESCVSLQVMIKNNIGCTQGMMGNSQIGREVFEGILQKFKTAEKIDYNEEYWCCSKMHSLDVVRNNLGRTLLDSKQFDKGMIILSEAYHKYIVVNESKKEIMNRYFEGGKAGDEESASDYVYGPREEAKSSDEIKSRDKSWSRDQARSYDEESRDEMESRVCGKRLNSCTEMDEDFDLKIRNLLLWSLVINLATVFIHLKNYTKAQEVLQHFTSVGKGLRNASKLVLLLRARVEVLQDFGIKALEILDWKLLDFNLLLKSLEEQSFQPCLFPVVDELCRVLVLQGNRTQSKHLLVKATNACEEAYGVNHSQTLCLKYMLNELHPVKPETPRTSNLLELVDSLLEDVVTVYKYFSIVIPKSFNVLKELQTRMQKLALSVIEVKDEPLSVEPPCVNSHAEDVIKLSLVTSSYILTPESLSDEEIFSLMNGVVSLMPLDVLTKRAIPAVHLTLTPLHHLYSIAALCFLLEAVLVIESTKSVYLICRTLLEIVTSRKRQEGIEEEPNMEIYKDFYGFLSCFLSYRQVLVSGASTSLCTIVTCGRQSKSSEDDVNSTKQPLFKMIELEENDFQEATEKRKLQSFCVVFLRSSDLLDIGELRDIGERNAKNVSSLVSPPKGILIEVVPEISLTNLPIAFHLPGTSLKTAAEFDCISSEKAANDLLLYSHAYQKRCICGAEIEPAVYSAVMLHQFTLKNLVEEVRKTSKKTELFFKKPEHGSLKMVSKDQHFDLCLEVLSSDPYGNDVIPNDVTKIVDDVFEKCSAHFGMSGNQCNPWHKIDDHSAELIHRENNDDDLQSILAAKVKLEEENNDLMNKVQELTECSEELQDKVADLEIRCNHLACTDDVDGYSATGRTVNKPTLSHCEAARSSHHSATNRVEPRDFFTGNYESLSTFHQQHQGATSRGNEIDAVPNFPLYDRESVQTNSLSLEDQMDEKTMREIGHANFHRERAERQLEVFVTIPHDILNFKKRTGTLQHGHCMEDPIPGTSGINQTGPSQKSQHVDDDTPYTSGINQTGPSQKSQHVDDDTPCTSGINQTGPSQKSQHVDDDTPYTSGINQTGPSQKSQHVDDDTPCTSGINQTGPSQKSQHVDDDTPYTSGINQTGPSQKSQHVDDDTPCTSGINQTGPSQKSQHVDNDTPCTSGINQTGPSQKSQHVDDDTPYTSGINQTGPSQKSQHVDNDTPCTSGINQTGPSQKSQHVDNDTPCTSGINQTGPSQKSQHVDDDTPCTSGIIQTGRSQKSQHVDDDTPYTSGINQTGPSQKSQHVDDDTPCTSGINQTGPSQKSQHVDDDTPCSGTQVASIAPSFKCIDAPSQEKLISKNMLEYWIEIGKSSNDINSPRAEMMTSHSSVEDRENQTHFESQSEAYNSSVETITCDSLPDDEKSHTSQNNVEPDSSSLPRKSELARNWRSSSPSIETHRISNCEIPNEDETRTQDHDTRSSDKRDENYVIADGPCHPKLSNFANSNLETSLLDVIRWRDSKQTEPEYYSQLVNSSRTRSVVASLRDLEKPDFAGGNCHIGDGPSFDEKPSKVINNKISVGQGTEESDCKEENEGTSSNIPDGPSFKGRSMESHTKISDEKKYDDRVSDSDQDFILQHSQIKATKIDSAPVVDSSKDANFPDRPGCEQGTAGMYLATDFLSLPAKLSTSTSISSHNSVESTSSAETQEEASKARVNASDHQIHENRESGRSSVSSQETNTYSSPTILYKISESDDSGKIKMNNPLLNDRRKYPNEERLGLDHSFLSRHTRDSRLRQGVDPKIIPRNYMSLPVFDDRKIEETFSLQHESYGIPMYGPTHGEKVLPKESPQAASNGKNTMLPLSQQHNNSLVNQLSKFQFPLEYILPMMPTRTHVHDSPANESCPPLYTMGGKQDSSPLVRSGVLNRSAEPIKSAVSNNMPTEPMRSVVSSNLPAEPMRSVVSNNLPAEPMRSVVSNNLPAEPVRSGVSTNMSTEPMRSVVSSNIPAEPMRSVVSSNMPAEPVRSGVSTNMSTEPMRSVVSSNIPAEPMRSVVSSNMPAEPVRSGVSTNMSTEPMRSVVSSNIPAEPMRSVVSSNMPAEPTGSLVSSNVPTEPIKSVVSNMPYEPIRSAFSDMSTEPSGSGLSSITTESMRPGFVNSFPTDSPSPPSAIPSDAESCVMEDGAIKSLEETVSRYKATVNTLMAEAAPEASKREREQRRKREQEEIEDVMEDGAIKSLEETVSRYKATVNTLMAEAAREASKREREQRRKREQEEIDRQLELRREKERDKSNDLPQPARLPVQESIGDRESSCPHFKRGCDVLFQCCNTYYQCHRCHNNSDQCDEKESKAVDGVRIRCRICMTEQDITSESHHCKNCNKKLSDYFCAICKHFTSDEKKPYHCGPCGICRIHRDNSFHCDVCGVCLNKRLRGKHKCRPDSGHDECCICLEDAFSGCQVLPCSHKVHRECAVLMVKNRVTTCPICRSPIYQN